MAADMHASIDQIVALLDAELQPGSFRDYCPNGLQVQGRSRVQTLVTGVTASQALLDRAVALGADAVLVHHGYFWNGESPVVTGMKYRRLRTLLVNDINLLAYHLPLDAHPALGNNACLAKLLGLEVTGPLPGAEPAIGLVGRLLAPMPGGEFCRRIAKVLAREPLHVPAARPITSVALCTGAAQGYIDQAAAIGVDAYLSGEVSEPTVHSARENGIHFYAAGHPATERYGVRALGDWLAARTGVSHHFVDIPNPA